VWFAAVDPGTAGATGRKALEADRWQFGRLFVFLLWLARAGSAVASVILTTIGPLIRRCGRRRHPRESFVAHFLFSHPVPLLK
jgi:hypothetical protein